MGNKNAMGTNTIPLTNDLADVIRYYRLKKGMEQTELAAAIDLATVSLSRIENCRVATISVATLKKIEEVLEFDASNKENLPSRALIQTALAKNRSARARWHSPDGETLDDIFRSLAHFFTEKYGYRKRDSHRDPYPFSMCDESGGIHVFDVRHYNENSLRSLRSILCNAAGRAAFQSDIVEYILVLPAEVIQTDFFLRMPIISNLIIDFSIVFIDYLSGQVKGYVTYNPCRHDAWIEYD